MKRLLLISALFVAACGAPAETTLSTPEDGVPQTDMLLETIRAAHPVTLSKIADNVWVHTTLYRVPGQQAIPSNGLAVLDGDEIILVDGAWGEMATLSLIAQVEDELDAPVKKMIVTHHHADRTAGVDAAELKGVEIFTHPDTPGLAFRAGFPVPNTTVAELKEAGSRIRVGAIEVAYPGPGHAQDNLVAYVPDANVLYGGCAIRGADSDNAGNISDADLERWQQSVAWMKAAYPDTALVVPGHGKGGDLSLLDQTIQIVTDAASQTE